MTTPVIPLNPGLVAIIGARGSGKTALADMIAAGCDSISDEAWNAKEWANPSFLVRARPLVGDGKVKVKWAAGDPETRALDGSDANGPRSYERVRYLSQQFVEDLCSSSGLTDGLLGEIERVIFEAHPDDTRDGSLDFPNCWSGMRHGIAWPALERPRPSRRFLTASARKLRKRSSSPAMRQRSRRRRNWSTRTRLTAPN